MSNILVTNARQHHQPTIILDDVEVSGFCVQLAAIPIMGLASILFFFMGHKQPASRQMIYFLTLVMTITSTLSYLAIISHHGMGYDCNILNPASMPVYQGLRLYCRQVFDSRAGDWFITSTVVIVQLSLVAGLNGATTASAIASNIFLFVCGRAAADHFTSDLDMRIAWAVFSSIFFAITFWQVASTCYNATQRQGSAFKKHFLPLLWFALAAYLVHFLVYLSAHVFSSISSSTELIVFAGLDIFFKTIFGYWLLSAYQKIPEFQFQVGGYWSEGIMGSQPRLLSNDNE